MTDTIQQRLDALYARIPEATIPCPSGCRECCGPIPMTRTEWDRIKRAHPHAIQPHVLADGTHVASRETVVEGQVKPRCPFVRETGKKRGCPIYAERPLMCRLYGNSWAMRCPHGCGAGNPLSPAEHNAILAEYHRIREDDR